jgi:carbon monoxide dehydrogenase subunit G
MRLEETFTVDRSRDDVVEVLADTETLTGLFPGDTELVENAGDRVTTRTHYTALGRAGVATFHWTYLLDGNVRFEKVCDGNVWRKLAGDVEVEEDGDGARLTLSLEGRTKPLVPEFTIKGQMESQIRDMTRALRDRLEGGRNA